MMERTFADDVIRQGYVDMALLLFLLVLAAGLLCVGLKRVPPAPEPEAARVQAKRPSPAPMPKPKRSAPKPRESEKDNPFDFS